MATVTLSVPDELIRKASAQLGKQGQADIREFLISSLISLAMEGRPMNPSSETQLLAGLDSPLIDANDAHWRDKLKKYDARHRARVKRI